MLARKALRAVEACVVRAGSPEVADPAPTSAALDKSWQEIRQRFHTELEPHFQIEEEFLAPPLLKRGESSLVQRLEQDHARLRALIADESRSLLVKVA